MALINKALPGKVRPQLCDHPAGDHGCLHRISIGEFMSVPRRIIAQSLFCRSARRGPREPKRKLLPSLVTLSAGIEVTFISRGGAFHALVHPDLSAHTGR
jgi:hypothetical protein